MYAVANCTISILRATTTDTYADVVDDPQSAPVATGVPANLISSSHTSWSQGTGTPRTQQRYTALVGSTTDVQAGDLIRDDTHGGITFTVLAATQPNAVGHIPDIQLDLDLLA